MKRRKGLRRKSKKGSDRDRNKGMRDDYLSRNWFCEWPGCKRSAVEVHHIVQKAGGSYETFENYFATCRKCHDKCHANNQRHIAIEVKVGKGEWFTTEDDEREYFGRLFRGIS